MSKEIEVNVVNNSKVTPEGYLTAQALGLALTVPGYFLAGGLTSGIHELREHVSPETLRTLVIATIALVNTLSTIRESKTLTEKGYSASPSSTLLHYGAGGRKSLRSSAGGHLAGAVQLYLIHPGTAFAAINTDPGLFLESAAASLIVTPALRTGANTLVLKGKAEPLVRAARPLGNAIRAVGEPMVRTAKRAGEPIARRFRK